MKNVFRLLTPKGRQNDVIFPPRGPQQSNVLHRRKAIQDAKVDKEISSFPKLTPVDQNHNHRDVGLCHVTDVGDGDLKVRKGVAIEEFLIAILFPLSIPWVLIRWGSAGMVSREYWSTQSDHLPRIVFQLVLGLSVLSIPALSLIFSVPSLAVLLLTAM